MKSAILSLLIGSAAAFAPAPAAKTTVAVNGGKADLEAIAQKANPVLKVGDMM